MMVDFFFSLTMSRHTVLVSGEKRRVCLVRKGEEDASLSLLIRQEVTVRTTILAMQDLMTP